MENNISSEKFASIIARILDDNKAVDIVILNVSNVCSLSDYFIIATGLSTPQVRGLTETVKKKIKDLDAAAVAKIIEYSSRIAESQKNCRQDIIYWKKLLPIILALRNFSLTKLLDGVYVTILKLIPIG